MVEARRLCAEKAQPGPRARRRGTSSTGPARIFRSVSAMQFNPDPCSYANITELRTSAIHMDLVMSFEGEALLAGLSLRRTASRVCGAASPAACAPELQRGGS